MNPATSPTTPPEPDRRVATRRQPAMGSVCRLGSGDGKPQLGLIWNISTTGVSMLVNTPPKPGDAVFGVLETMASGFTMPITAQVVHVKKLETGDYFLGAHFDKALTPEEMKPFVA